MTQPASIDTTVSPNAPAQPAKPTLDDATAIAQAKAPPAQTKTITVKPAPYDIPGAYSFHFYKADAHGATPLEWRCIVNGSSGMHADLALSELGIDQPEALLARLHLAAVTQ